MSHATSTTQTKENSPRSNRSGSSERPRRRREPRPVAPWIPQTTLGKKVSSGEIDSIEPILESGCFFYVIKCKKVFFVHFLRNPNIERFLVFCMLACLRSILVFFLQYVLHHRHFLVVLHHKTEYVFMSSSDIPSNGSVLSLFLDSSGLGFVFCADVSTFFVSGVSGVSGDSGVSGVFGISKTGLFSG